MNAITVATQFMHKDRRWLRNFCLHNVAPAPWFFECDILELTKAGFFVEYEIKLSRGDFFADAKKTSATQAWDAATKRMIVTESKAKHDMLAAAHEHGPTRFNFITPMGMVTKEEVPAWAGLITFAKHPRRRGYVFHTDKEAPRLHNKKSVFTREKLVNTCYYRMHELLTRNANSALDNEEKAAKRL